MLKEGKCSKQASAESTGTEWAAAARYRDYMRRSLALTCCVQYLGGLAQRERERANGELCGLRWRPKIGRRRHPHVTPPFPLGVLVRNASYPPPCKVFSLLIAAFALSRSNPSLQVEQRAHSLNPHGGLTANMSACTEDTQRDGNGSNLISIT